MTKSATQAVPLLDLEAQHDRIRVEIQEAIARVLDSQQFILGPEVQSFEREVAAYCQTSYAIGCASGSDALLLALMALGIGAGDEVITTPYSFFATVSAIVRLGATPVFVDIDSKTFNLEVGQVEGKITPRTKAILPIHLFGQCAQMSVLGSLAEAFRLAIIEDAAQAIGARFADVPAGKLGAVAAFSFYPSKNLGGAGDGGMLTTDDQQLAERLYALRAHGARRKYYHDMLGINSRLDSLQAAILRVKLRHLDEWATRRRANAATYRELFAQTDLMREGLIDCPEESLPAFHVYNQFVIRARNRDALRKHLQQAGIGTEIYYPLPLHLQPCFASLGHREGDFPVAEAAAAESLAIPIYPELTSDQQHYIVETISDYYQSA